MHGFHASSVKNSFNTNKSEVVSFQKAECLRLPGFLPCKTDSSFLQCYKRKDKDEEEEEE